MPQSSCWLSPRRLPSTHKIRAWIIYCFYEVQPKCLRIYHCRNEGYQFLPGYTKYGKRYISCELYIYAARSHAVACSSLFRLFQCPRLFHTPIWDASFTQASSFTSSIYQQVQVGDTEKPIKYHKERWNRAFLTNPIFWPLYPNLDLTTPWITMNLHNMTNVYFLGSRVGVHHLF